tara:strand:- start:10144 stop:10491 length:348 start_codon:yes stop_codon:yes gene_type:complete
MSKIVNIPRLIECFKYPESSATTYQGDIADDVIDVLEEVNKFDEVRDANSELFAMLPCEDIFDELIDELDAITKMSKPEMISNIKKCIEQLNKRAEQFERSREFAQVEYLKNLEE